MATQSGITIDGPNKPYTVVSNIPRPSPGPRQVLVKCLGVGINPIEPLQHHSGLLVNEWPAIIGSDCAAVVVDTSPDCTKLKPGDYVYGCAPLVEDTCTIGVGLLTAGLCLLAGAELTLPEDGSKAPEKDEWIVVLGGSGSVGQFAVQIAHVCGYKVLASCSPSKDSIAKENGATATFNSRGSTEEQVADIKKITDGNFARIIDSTTYGYEVMVKALETCSTATKKYLTSVDDWSEFKTPPTITEYRAELGHLCRLDEALGVEVTSTISSLIPTFETHLAAGTLKPIQYQVVDGMGWDKVIEGIQDLESGKAAKKIVVRVQKE